MRYTTRDKWMKNFEKVEKIIISKVILKFRLSNNSSLPKFWAFQHLKQYIITVIKK